MIFIGLDPGFSGAIALLGDEGSAEVYDMPTFTPSKGKQQLDFANLARILGEAAQRGPCNAAVELVASRPGQGISSTFRFGQAYGAAIATLAASKIPYELITPATWKRGFRLIGCEKEDSRRRALELFPALAAELRFKKNDGRAEALLIAEYLRRQHTQGAAAA